MKLKITTIVVALLAFTVVLTPAFAQAVKVQDCHRTDNGTFHLISIDISALPAHIAHGDGQPGDPVPNMDGFIFGPNCTPTVVPPPELPIGCYELVNNPLFVSSIDISYNGPIDTLGNTTFFKSSDGTCSGTGVSLPGIGIIAAGNAADAQNKCNALTGQTGAFIFDLGSELLPSEPGFWLCIAPPSK
jgi:hypothetical protein